jgi:hypothetical protein
MCALGLWATAPVTAQGVTPPALKAAFLLNFARFAEWPGRDAADLSPLLLCVADDRRTHDALVETVRGQVIGGRPLSVRAIATEAEAGACQLVYVGGWDEAQTNRLLEAVKSTPILTVSQRPRFAARGGVVELFVDHGRMRFAVNVDAARDSGMKLSAQLLKLAKIVRRGDAE